MTATISKFLRIVSLSHIEVVLVMMKISEEVTMSIVIEIRCNLFDVCLRIPSTFDTSLCEEFQKIVPKMRI